MKWSIRARLTVWFSVLMVAALTVLSVGVLWLHARWARAQFDTGLASLAATLSHVMQEELNERSDVHIAAAEMRKTLEVPDRATAILDVSGRPIFANWHGFPHESTTLSAATSHAPQITTVSDGVHAWSVVTRRESSTAGDYTILVAGSLDQLRPEQDLLLRVLLVATPLIVLLTAALSWWVASSALRPVTTMAAQAEAITARSPDRLLLTPTATDELGQLARAFNRLLTRLGTALQMQRQFMADASHELRTPVSVIQTATEVTLQRQARDDWEYREALTIINEQSARLGSMVESMLALARADAGGYRLTRKPVYIDDIVAECTRAVSVVAATREVEVVTTLQPDVSVDGDESLLLQLVTNLLDNAVQYTPAEGLVTVSVASTAAFAIITVSDTGPGIPPGDRERVFERFVRLDPARSRSTGAGLGLPIARWIAEEHGGTLIVEDSTSGGCTLVARLPLKSGAPADASAAARRDQTSEV
jgi:two-component system, OmpR family, sensor kinase